MFPHVPIRYLLETLELTLPTLTVLMPFVDASMNDPATPELEVRDITWYRIRFSGQ